MDLLGIIDLEKKDLEQLLTLSEKLKREHKEGKTDNSLDNKTLTMLFEKSSTRTRVSFEAAMGQMGGHSIYLDYTSSQLARGETIGDTAKVLSRYSDILAARLYKHSDLEELANNSDVPVINALTDLEHPCQAIADIFTAKENGKLEKGKKFAFVGDCAFNMANSLMLAFTKMQMDVVLVCPPGYSANEKYLSEARKFGNVEIEHDPKKGVEGADIVYTDVWVSMGLEDEKAERMKEFTPYQVNEELMKSAKDDAIALHCLPAHRGVEITSEVLDGKQSAVWDQAENRMHTQKAIMLKLLGKE